jgi:hypothetical protein
MKYSVVVIITSGFISSFDLIIIGNAKINVIKEHATNVDNINRFG